MYPPEIAPLPAPPQSGFRPPNLYVYSLYIYIRSCIPPPPPAGSRKKSLDEKLRYANIYTHPRRAEAGGPGPEVSIYPRCSVSDLSSPLSGYLYICSRQAALGSLLPRGHCFAFRLWFRCFLYRVARDALHVVMMGGGVGKEKIWVSDGEGGGGGGFDF